MNFFQLSLRQPRRPKRIPRGPVIRLPAAIWHKYRNALETIVNRWRETAVVIVLDKIPAIARQADQERTGTRTDSWPDEITEAMELLRLEYDRLAAQAHDIALNTFNKVNIISRMQWYDRVKNLMGLNFLSFEPWIQNESKAWIKENVALITKLQGDTVQDIDRIVTNGLRTGRRVEDIRKQILGTDLEPGVFKKVETRAELIARDQTGKLLGDLNCRRQEEMGITIYIWRTANDERVRGNPGGSFPNSKPSHYALNGKYCSWRDPAVYADTLTEAMAGEWKHRSSIDAFIGNPGEDYQCRCGAEAVFETLYEGEQ